MQEKPEKNPQKLRDYGLPTLGKPKGKPKWWITEPPVECPNCGAVICHIEVEAEPIESIAPLLRGLTGGKAYIQYFGCPACPWASKAIISAK